MDSDFINTSQNSLVKEIQILIEKVNSDATETNLIETQI